MTLVRDPRRLATLAVVAILVGATAFGVWHVVVGLLVNGNPRAAAFGAGLAAVAGTALAGLVLVIRRRSRG